MAVRPAAAVDAAATLAIWNHYIRDTAVTFTSEERSLAEVTALIRERPAFFVAEDEGRVAGFATYTQFRGGAGYVRTMEHSVQLAPDATGRGLGRALMAAVERHALGAGVHSLIAGISGENPAGRRFHARLGYAEVAVLPQVGWKFGRWMDLVLMQKILT